MSEQLAASGSETTTSKSQPASSCLFSSSLAALVSHLSQVENSAVKTAGDEAVLADTGELGASTEHTDAHALTAQNPSHSLAT